MNKIELLFTGNATSAVAAAKETEAAVLGVGTKSEEVSRKGAGLSSMFGGATKSALGLAKVFLPLAAVVGAADFAKGAIEGAENLEKAQRSLDEAIAHTGGDAAKLRPQYDALAKSAAEYGITQQEATSALARATLLTGDAEKAQRAYEEALVISKATGRDLNSVLIATSKGQDGMTTALRRYGILVDSSASGQDQFNQVMKTFGGQAEANTTSADRLRANFENLQTSLGTLVLPAVVAITHGLADLVNFLNEKAVPAIQSMIAYVVQHWPQIQATIGPIMAEIKADIEQVLADAEAFWRRFGGTITTVLTDVKTDVKDALAVLQAVFKLLGDLLRGDWSQAWHDFGKVVSSELKLVEDEITQAGTLILKGLEALASLAYKGAKDLGGAIVHGIEDGLVGLGKALVNAIVAPLNAVISAWDRIAFNVHVPGVNTHIPGVGTIGGFDFGFQVPQIPQLAAGGIVTMPTLAMIGEGGPEAVIPLDRFGGGGVTVSFAGAHIYGAPTRQILDSWADGIASALERRGPGMAIAR